MKGDDETSQKRWFDGGSLRSHIRDTAHLLTRGIMLFASMACW